MAYRESKIVHRRSRIVHRLQVFSSDQRSTNIDQRLNDQRPHFRFEDLEIWQLAKGLAVCFLKLTDNLGKIGGEDE